MSAYPPNTLSLVADVGGTNTRVALAKGTQLLPETVKKFRNAEYPGLDTVLELYVQEKEVDCIAAAAAIAGPVRDGKGTLTNLDWSIDAGTLARATKAENVAVLNDLQAQGYGVGLITSENLIDIAPGKPSAPGATSLVIGVGTGFNAAPVFQTGGTRIVPPSESGHINLPPRTESELRLYRYIEERHGGFASVEDVLSGRGLERVYAWHASEAGQTVHKSAAEIMEACANRSDPVALETVSTFNRLLGTVAGNLALIYLPFGGVYFIGGVARAVSTYFQETGFIEQFSNKGRFGDFMGAFPISVITDDYAALSGLASHLTELG
ncbi:MAG: ROK family protein [Paracoccaceae bacterium]